ncbi:MAG: hypothetical protein ABIG03_01240 [Candidatus Eisenbacteria bacterium]
MATAVRWLARIGGTALLLKWIRHAPHELTTLLEEQWSYGERIFSVGFLAMLLGLVAGWLSDKLGAALLIAGFLLAAGAPVLGTCSRPMLAPDALGVAVILSPFFAVGVAYAFAGRTRPSFS